MSEKIKILHIAQSAGGVAEYIKNFLQNIDKSEYDNVMVVSNDYKNEEQIKKNSSKMIYIDMIREINLKKDIKAVAKIKKIVKQEKPDIIYLHSSKAGALGRIALIFNSKIKIVYNAHGWYFNADIGKKKILFQFIEKILAYKTDKIIAISNSEYNSALEKKICNKNKIIQIDNGIDFEKYEDCNKYRDNMRKKYNIGKDAILVGVVGRISEQKDPITTIKAANKAIKNNSNIYFMFVGTGNLEQEILKYAEEQNITSNIIVTGWVKDVKQYISMFDIALLPSKWEGFGLAIVEYIACKKPIIATRIGGIADILNKPNMAFFIRKENYDDIVSNIEYITNNKNEVLNMIKNNYEECKERFSIEREMQKHNNLFKELLEKGETNEKNI